jgi:hypothetical protein
MENGTIRPKCSALCHAESVLSPPRGSCHFRISTPPSPHIKKKRGAQMGLELWLPYGPRTGNEPGIVLNLIWAFDKIDPPNCRRTFGHIDEIDAPSPPQRALGLPTHAPKTPQPAEAGAWGLGSPGAFSRLGLFCVPTAMIDHLGLNQKQTYRQVILSRIWGFELRR